MKRVLMVEDDADIRTSVAHYLRFKGYQVTEATTVAEARRHLDEGGTDLALLDLMLPDRSGVDLCRELRADRRTERVPIILLTARTAEEDRVRGFAAGADDYVCKPFSLNELAARVHALLRRADGPAPPPLPARWLHQREQVRLWMQYAELHLARSEWRPCDEICRAILARCADVLTTEERRGIYRMMARCAERLGNDRAVPVLTELARHGTRLD